LKLLKLFENLQPCFFKNFFKEKGSETIFSFCAVFSAIKKEKKSTKDLFCFFYFVNKKDKDIVQ
jgi:hypothetical protein